MAITIQSNASGDWVDISALSLLSGESITLGINNTGAEALVIIWAAGVGNQSPSAVVDRQGKEAVTESWYECKLSSDSAWTPLSFPASFPLLFSDLASVGGVFSLTAPTAARTSVDFRNVQPASVSSSGEINLQLTLRYL